MPEPLDERRFVAGFVMWKLYHNKCFARRKSAKHGKHIQLSSLPTGLTPGRGDPIYMAREMNGKTVKIFKSTGDDHVCALLDDDAIKAGLDLCNYYLKNVGLPLLDKSFHEMIEEKKAEEKREEYHKLTDKEKRNKEYLERMKKWMKDEGLSNQTS